MFIFNAIMTKMKGDAANGDEHTSSSLLPLAPRTLCFDKNEFMKVSFNLKEMFSQFFVLFVAIFLSKSKHVTCFVV